MRIFIVTVGEPVPLPQYNERLYRSGTLAQLLADKGHDVVWFTSNFNHFTKEYHKNISDQVKLSPSYKMVFLKGTPYKKNIGVLRLLNHLVIGGRFHSALKRHGLPDIIITSLPTVELSFVSALFAKGRGIPCIVDIRDLWPDIFSDFVTPLLRIPIKLVMSPLYALKRYALANATSLVGISSQYLNWGLKSAQRERGPHDRIIPLGYSSHISIDRTEPNQRIIRNRMGIKDGSLVVVFVGTFGASYDIKSIVAAARLLYEQGHDIRFLLCGEGEERVQLESGARNLANIEFLGWLNAPKLAEILSIADVGLAAYRAGAPQSLPNKLFEYLSAGLPVLSSLTGEAKDLIRENYCGLTYKSEDPSSLASRILQLHQDPALRLELAKNAAQTFNQKFSQEKVFGAYIDLIESLANKCTAETVATKLLGNTN